MWWTTVHGVRKSDRTQQLNSKNDISLAIRFKFCILGRNTIEGIQFPQGIIMEKRGKGSMIHVYPKIGEVSFAHLVKVVIACLLFLGIGSRKQGTSCEIQIL